MAAWLATQGHVVNRKRVERLMRLAGLVAIYQKPNTSKPAVAHKIYPYLLGGISIERVNQVWCSDVTYIPMAKGFLYLVVIMDWVSRAVLAWRLSNTLGVEFCVEALEEAFSRYGRPEIFNTDQGSQFTSSLPLIIRSATASRPGTRSSSRCEARCPECTCVSMNPGITSFLPASITRSTVPSKAFADKDNLRVLVGEFGITPQHVAAARIADEPATPDLRSHVALLLRAARRCRNFWYASMLSQSNIASARSLACQCLLHGPSRSSSSGPSQLHIGGILTSSHRPTRASAICSVRRPSPGRAQMARMRRFRPFIEPRSNRKVRPTTAPRRG